MFQFPQFRLVNLCIQLTIVQRITGFPHSDIAGSRVHITSPALFAELASFIASDCRGIHRVRLVA